MVIDLGEVRQLPEAADPPPPPTRRRLRGFAVVGVAAALLAAGSATPVRSGLVEKSLAFSFDHTGIFVDDVNGLFVAHHDALVKYDLFGAGPRWRVSIPAYGQGRGGFAVGRTVLVASEGVEPSMLALDGDTGRELWRHAGSPNYTDEHQVLLAEQRTGEATIRYTAVEPATGRVRWTLTDPDGLPTLYDEKRFVRWWPSGRVEVRDLPTGRVVATGSVPPPKADSAVLSGGLGVQVAGGLMLVAAERDGRQVADAYDLERLERRWTAELDPANEFVSNCGDALCVSRATGTVGVRVLDRETGRTRWSDDRWGGLESFGPVLIAYGGAADAPSIAILDPASGQRRADLGSWELGWPRRNGRTLAIRTGLTPNRVTIGEVDLAAGTVRILGVARDASSCLATPVAVICRRSGGSIGIWHPRRRLDE